MKESVSRQDQQYKQLVVIVLLAYFNSVRGSMVIAIDVLKRSKRIFEH